MPPTLLHLETATEICSVALSKGDKIIASLCLDKGNSHIEHLFPFIEQVLTESNCKISELDGVVLSIGPGSYTGLRIGASAAKGICYALEIPLIGISTLQSIVFGAIRQQKEEKNVLYCPMIDARRMEVFTALFNENGEVVTEVDNKIIDEHSFASELENHIIYFCGNGMPKCKSVLQHPNAHFIDAPLEAANMLLPALAKYENKQFEDVAYFEPFYLKEYIAKKSVVKGL
ncbi:MAG: tRNA (adenosine(37)-N6)-threonylcarbamoyltransferase complex dimerization subunit type 1 TsaB [Bacteroidetes bacterium]|nr:tRNA (adenosine(37)-N6)-threonylcarbamoyltransferase complex dimerization subunit type 1 TsaB [Bacteroidota bacterium]MCL2303214.1 tRNA (adenosine(37)-N6)-threonylcarbamoyltransferase complex dimerization subunit type 1 TsaB [Lentimicrobiaceae bacterium]